MKKNNLALIGSGYWGKILLKYLKAHPGFKVKYICNSKTQLSKIWDNVEAVIVATPTQTHFRIVKQALLHHKHVFSEKPLALKTKECLELKELAKKQKLTLIVDYTWTFSQALKKALKIKIGKIKAIEMEIKQLNKFLKEDVYYHLGSHLLAVLDMFIPLKKLTFKKIDLIKNKGLAETGLIIFGNKEIKGKINVNVNHPEKQVKIIIYGTQGTIIFEPLAKKNLRINWYKKIKGAKNKNLITKVKSYSFNERDNLKYAVEYFYKALNKKAKSNINRAVLVTKIIENLKTIKN